MNAANNKANGQVVYGGEKSLSSNVFDIMLLLLGALLLPVYWVIFKYDEFIFNMVQCAHVILVSLYAVIYINYIKKECFAANELRYKAFNFIFMYTMFIFFILFVSYIARILLNNR
jgi:hypothetical protein